MSKWERFSHKTSDVKAGSINRGDCNLIQDWNRLLNTSATVNGKLLREAADGAYIRYDNVGEEYLFKNKESLYQFFREVLLKGINIPEDSTDLDEYLEKILHQGSLMNPVSSPLSSYIDEKVRGLQPCCMAWYGQ